MKDLNFFLPDKSAPDHLLAGQYGNREHEISINLITSEVASALLRPRDGFSHKGTYGHALIIAGKKETMGAALLASQGSLYAGAGLTTACIPESGLTALNTSLPEVMYLSREQLLQSKNLDKYNALAIGPGLGQEEDATLLLSTLIDARRPLVADADALNILAIHKPFVQTLTDDSILTPHVKEFDALFGAHRTWFERVQTAIRKAVELKVVIVLKNRYTFIIDQEGVVNINTSGDPAMAQGGMGDVLTGVITAYIAQGHSSRNASVLGCYMHGAAGGDLAINRANITASALARHLPVVNRKMQQVR